MTFTLIGAGSLALFAGANFIFWRTGGLMINLVAACVCLAGAGIVVGVGFA